MRFAELQPQWIRHEVRPCHVGAPGCITVSPHTEHEWYVPSDMANAQGVQYLCPRCYADKGSTQGVHSIVSWFKGRSVPDDLKPGPGRWILRGSSYDDTTFDNDGQRSVLLLGGCSAHFHVTNGEITWA